jgi:pyruvate kinase
MVCDSAFNLYKSLKIKNKQIKGFITFTKGGKTPRMLSRYRPHVPIYAFCQNEEDSKKLSISFGVIPIFQTSLKEKTEIVKDDIQSALNILKDKFEYKSGDTFIVLHGDYWTSDLGTSTIRLITA